MNDQPFKTPSEWLEWKHRVVGHRLEPCTLVDLRGQKFRGLACRCGYVDDDAWQLVEAVVPRESAS